MFHDYILTGACSVVDFDRASLLMDKTLLRQSLRAMMIERNTKPRWDAGYGAQWVWDDYCERHLEKYGAYFEPDVIQGWDNSPTPAQGQAPPPPR
jgi:hypothetical protein